MALTILNNISALTAQNSLSNTQMNLQKTLTQLSTGLKINSGSDDSAGLSIANGMQANIAAKINPMNGRASLLHQIRHHITNQAGIQMSSMKDLEWIGIGVLGYDILALQGCSRLG